MVAPKYFCLLLAGVFAGSAATLNVTAQEGAARQTLVSSVGPEAAEARQGTSAPGIQAVQRDPVGYAGATLVAAGTVVRTSRRLEGADARTSLLLRDAAGDTISVLNPAELPPVGSRIQVSGRIELLGGVPVLGGGEAGLALQVVERAPDGAAAGRRRDENGLRLSATRCLNPRPRSLSALTCAVLRGPSWTWLGLLGVAALGAGGWVLWRRSRRWDDAPVPLIVDLTVPQQTGIAGWELETAPESSRAEAAVTPAEAVAGDSSALPDPVPGAAAAAGTSAAVSEAPSLGGPAAASPPPGGEPKLATSVGAERRNGHRKAGERAKVPGATAPGGAGAANRPPVPSLSVNRILPASVESATLVPESPDEAVLQLLPGRLEVVAGDGLSPEIRLFRLSSLEVPEITFGRADGPAYRHVKLTAPTVSREHARIRYEDRKWKMINLSRINPVVVNGVEMASPDDEWTLGDGDRIEIGEVVLRFREG